MIRRLTAWLSRSGWHRLALWSTLLHGRPTDRGHLLLAPEPSDNCELWTQEIVSRDCETDGHYLCRTCRRCSFTQEFWR